MSTTTKSGKRHSTSDQAHLNDALSHILSAGATLPEVEDEGEVDMADDTSETAAPEMKSDDFLITQSNEVKSLGDGKFGGYLVRFGDASVTDLDGDYFTADTDFDFADGQRTTVYYDHGLDPVLKRRKVGEGSLKRDEAGVWLEFQLQRRDEYEQHIEALAKKGKLGLSSGTAPHLVERVREGKANRIIAWPLGIDASVTPTPAEPRTMVQSLKSYLAAPLVPVDDIASADGSEGDATGGQPHSATQRERALMLELELLDL